MVTPNPPTNRCAVRKKLGGDAKRIKEGKAGEGSREAEGCDVQSAALGVERQVQ